LFQFFVAEEEELAPMYTAAPLKLVPLESDLGSTIPTTEVLVKDREPLKPEVTTALDLGRSSENPYLLLV
jgi:hypothetical protein